MIYTQVTAPIYKPVSLNDAKDQIKNVGTSDDPLIQAYLDSAIDYVEKYTGRALITQTWDLFIDYYPWGALLFPKPPLQSIVSVNYVDQAGNTQLLDPSYYVADTDSIPGRFYRAYLKWFPTVRVQPKAVTIRFVAGYGKASDVPETLKQAIILRTQMLYEQPINFDYEGLDNALHSLLDPYRVNFTV